MVMDGEKNVGAVGSENPRVVSLRLIPTNKRLVQERKLRGWTQAYLANLANISSCKLGHIETLRVIPSQNEMEGLASILGVPEEELFPDELLYAIRRGIFSHRTVDLTKQEVASIGTVYQKFLTMPPEFENDAMLSQLKDDVLSVLKTLTPREQRVLTLRFGLDGGGSRTDREVGEEFNISKGRVQQVEAKALRKLRHPSRSRVLIDYVR